MLDEKLSFNDHVDLISSKISKKINFLKRIGKNMTTYMKLLLFKSIIMPHFEYCSTLLLGLSKEKTQQLQKLQNRAMRTILKCNRYTPIQSMLNCLELMSVKQRILFATYIFIFKFKNKLFPYKVMKNVTCVSDVHSHNTRNADNFYMQVSKHSKHRNSIFYEGFNAFNKLPSSIKAIRDLKVFKRKLAKFVLNIKL
ncbi:hypothetical protein WA026_012348 [Henosepilachna vigintioctopunctata]|uniref:Uncharacterized protein n=1 Tax=Henosepilachna vigintioctopunctata TaxID=420089 RepID=A0AAW1V062_9CUCU